MGGTAVTPIAPPAPTFPGANNTYLSTLQSSGITPASFGSLTNIAKTGNPTDVGPAFEAMKASMAHGTDEARSNVKEQFGVKGLTFGSDIQKGGADFEAQNQANLNNILSQYTMQASESAAQRQLQASTIGSQASGEAGLAVSPTQVAGGPTGTQTAVSGAIDAAKIAAMIAMFA